jgi:hypothetical protein
MVSFNETFYLGDVRYNIYWSKHVVVELFSLYIYIEREREPAY